MSTTKKRNSLIELYRFLFALNVVTGDYLSGIWGYLRYVHAMFVVFLYVIIRAAVKIDRAQRNERAYGRRSL